MKGTGFTWLLLLASAAALLGGTLWVSELLLHFDSRETLQRIKEGRDDQARLALWRLESHLSSFVTAENARPYGDYLNQEDPAFEFDEQWVKLYFHLSAQGQQTHPSQTEHDLQPLLDTLKDGLPQKVGLKPPQQRLEAQDLFFDNSYLQEEVENLVEAQEKNDREAKDQKVDEDAGFFGSLKKGSRKLQSLSDYQARSQVAEGAYTKRNFIFKRGEPKPKRAKTKGKLSPSTPTSLSSPMASSLYSAVDTSPKPSPSSPTPIEGVLKPRFIEQYLVFEREVHIGDREERQGMIIDWEQFNSWARDRVSELCPNLSILQKTSMGSEVLPMAMIPAFLSPNWPNLPTFSPSPAMKATLLILWSSMALILVVVALLFRGMVQLSARKGMFASAVTHELRTPLTSFNMYTEMLDENMVRDEEQRKTYIGILRREATRLAHLVENVLAYSRVEQRKLKLVHAPMPWETFIERVTERSRQFDESRGGHMSIEDTERGKGPEVRTDPDHVEQIIFNLVENAHKYAKPDHKHPLKIKFSVSGRCFRIVVKDEGPGISPRFRKRLFQPFSKSDRDAANTSHGVGLGLALCKALAKQLGGKLRLEKTTVGASFEVTLPLSKKN